MVCRGKERQSRVRAGDLRHARKSDTLYVVLGPAKMRYSRMHPACEVLIVTSRSIGDPGERCEWFVEYVARDELVVAGTGDPV